MTLVMTKRELTMLKDTLLDLSKFGGRQVSIEVDQALNILAVAEQRAQTATAAVAGN